MEKTFCQPIFYEFNLFYNGSYDKVKPPKCYLNIQKKAFLIELFHVIKNDLYLCHHRNVRPVHPSLFHCNALYMCCHDGDAQAEAIDMQTPESRVLQRHPGFAIRMASVKHRAP